MFEQLLYNQIINNADLTGMLSSYDGSPAFFYQKIPDDTDRRWSKPEYPRIDYNIDMRDDPERNVSGTLILNIWCSDESDVMPEDIEPKLIGLVSGTFYTTGDKITLCAVWNRSDAFEYAKQTIRDQKDRSSPIIIGLSLTFDITAFPVQITTNPDMIQAVNEWSKSVLSPALVIGYDKLPGIWKPTDNKPAIYWRINGISISDKNSYAVSWYECQLTGHILTENITERSTWLKMITEELNTEGEILLADKSPLFINRIVLRNDADQLREGQITLSATYGVLNTPKKESVVHKLMHAHFEYKNQY